MEKIFKQTSFVDLAESGTITPDLQLSEIVKFNKLSEASKEQLRKGLENAGIWSWMFREMLELKRYFSVNQFIQFRAAIQYYKDLEDEARRNHDLAIARNTVTAKKPLHNTA